MQKRWLLNAILLSIVLILASLALLKWKSDAPPVIDGFTLLDKKQIQSIVISRTDDKQISEIVLQKQAEQWFVHTPLQLPANQFRVDSILQFLTTKHYQSLKMPVDLAKLGLEQPAIRLAVDGIELDLGIKSPFNDGRRYVLFNNKAYLVVDTISYFLTGDAALFASLSPLGNQPEIVSLSLPNLSLQLQGHRWEFTTPIDKSLDNSADAIQGLVKAWQNLQALSVRQYDAQKEHLAPISIKLATDAQALQFKIVETEPEFILALPEKKVQYQIGSEQLKGLFSLPEKL
ncbi:MAG: DUF4340 domain-containing protein [Thiotrichaceae bacterium]|nr:DUF4340 domain-containing protein [Thiotrichaceae bacterium]